MNPDLVSLPAPLELNIDLTDEQFFQLGQISILMVRYI